jgi:hypothetical protein
MAARTPMGIEVNRATTGEAEGQGDADPIADQIGDGGVVEIGAAEIAAQGGEGPVGELDDDGAIETVGFADGVDVELGRLRAGDGNREIAGQTGQREADGEHRQRHQKREQEAAEEKAQHGQSVGGVAPPPQGGDLGWTADGRRLYRPASDRRFSDE